MMSFVKKEAIKIIVCEKVDRLTRNFKDAVEIDEWLEKDEERQVHLVLSLELVLLGHLLVAL